MPGKAGGQEKTDNGDFWVNCELELVGFKFPLGWVQVEWSSTDKDNKV